MLFIRIGRLIGFVTVGAAAVGLTGPTAAFAAIDPPIAPFAECPNLGYQVQSQDGITSTYGYFDLNTSTFVPIKNLGSSVNGTGYSRSQRVFWGMRTNPDNNTLMRWDSEGNTTDFGPLNGVPAGQAIRTNVGTIDDQDRLLILTRDPAADKPGLVGPINNLIAIDVDPSDGAVGDILSQVPLSRATPGDTFLRIGDWDFNPTDGLLYSVEMVGDTKRELISINPATGEVKDIIDLSGKLPDSQNYGAVYVEDVSGTIYVSANDVDDHLAHGEPGARSQTLSIYPPYTNPPVIAYTPGAPLLINDGADCLVATDFGDAPDNFHTLNPHGGPGHIFTEVNHPGQQLRIGTKIDADLDGIPTSDAEGDDKNLAVNDEDGVAPGTVVALDNPTLTVPVTNTTDKTATLVGWLDLDTSNSFDLSELALATVAPGQTSVELKWRAPEHGGTESAERAYLRLRLFPWAPGDPRPTRPDGAAFIDGGEVEDHMVSLGLPDTGQHLGPILGLGLGMLGVGVVLTVGVSVARPKRRRPSPRPRNA